MAQKRKKAGKEKHLPVKEPEEKIRDKEPEEKIRDKELAEKIRNASTFSTDELLKEITEHPQGRLSVRCCIDFYWDCFCEQYRITPPQRQNYRTEDEFKQETERYGHITELTKKMANFWYVVGMSHHQELHEQFIKALHTIPGEGENE